MLGIVGCSADSACVGDSRSYRDAHFPADSLKSSERSTVSMCSPASQLQAQHSTVVTARGVERTRDPAERTVAQ